MSSFSRSRVILHQSPDSAARWVVLIGLCLVALILGTPADSRASVERWEAELRDRGLDPAGLIDPLAASEAMRAEARAATGQGAPVDRLRRLQEYLFDPGRFPFDYSSHETHTAEQAFRLRRGNCVSFTMLFIALARSAQLPVKAALLTFPDEVEKSGELIIVNNHLVAVYEHSGGTLVYDFYLSREGSAAGVRPLDDMRTAAIYFTNLGAEALFDGRLPEAREQLEVAVRLAPEFAVAYGNLGLVRRRQGDVEGALEAYRAAIEIDPGQPTILHNLAALYRSLGREAEARIVLQSLDHRGRTPYLLLMRGDFELHDGDLKTAARLYGQAVRMAPRLADPHVAMARVRWLQGRPKAARKSAARAVEIEPDHEKAREILEQAVEAIAAGEGGGR